MKVSGGMARSLFYNLGKKLGPRVRRAKWAWGALTGTEADVIRLEQRVGLDLAQEARDQLQMDRDPGTREVLDEVGARLASRVANKLRSFHFDAFSGGEPNAFALPGGFIFASRSILDLCQGDTDQMAFILAHEMGHVISGHAIKRIMTHSAVSVVSCATPVQGVLGPWLRRVGVQFLVTAYSRDQELDADALAARLADAAGYDPRAGVTLFRNLAELKKTPDSLGLGEYFSTHPSFEVRINALQRSLKSRSASSS